MLKKSGSILLLLLYLITGIGFTVNLHYCGRLITAVSVDTPLKSCKESGMMPGMKCCKNKHIDIKLKDAHHSETPTFLSKIFSFKLVALNLPYSPVLPLAAISNNVYYRGPPAPVVCATPAFIRYCSFRI